MSSHTECVIVGAGFAGAASAYALARRGITAITVVERERTAGYHASGRNAAMAYRFLVDDQVRALAREGHAFLRTPPGGFPRALDNRWTGSLTLLTEAHFADLAPVRARMAAEGLGLQVWSPARIGERIPLLAGRAPGAVGVFLEGDGVADIHGLLEGYLAAARRAGARVRYGVDAQALIVEGGVARGVVTSDGPLRAERVILAGGAWANELAVAQGLAPLPLRPCRRHLAVLDGVGAPFDASWPFTWDQSGGFYFRPESAGLLVCACDVEEVAPADVSPRDAFLEELLEVALRRLAIPRAGVRRAWAGLRTLTPDGRFIVGDDPRLPGLFWVAGLGGHGMTTSAAVGEVVADLVTAGDTDRVDRAAFAPDRFVGTP